MPQKHQTDADRGFGAGGSGSTIVGCGFVSDFNRFHSETLSPVYVCDFSF